MTEANSFLHQWHRSVPTSLRGPAAFGLGVLLCASLGFGVWASTAPISSAVIAGGKFIATGQNKIIQHLEGGIVERILVQEGDIVVPGQSLVRLDETSARAQQRRLVLKRYRLLAMQARLETERLGKDGLTFGTTLTDRAADPEVAAIVKGQTAEFAARSHELASEINVLERRIAAIREEIIGLTAQRDSSDAQLQLILEEIKGQEQLYEKGLTRLTTLLALRRAKAKLEGDRGEFVAKIGRAKERITETEGQIIHLKFKRVEEVVKELQGVESELGDVEERIKAARDVLTRLDVKAPVRGVVVKILHHTAGGVIKAGEQILELLPIEDELLVEAFIRPIDIDAVQKGNRAQLRLTALNQRVTPMVPGRVIYVSADTIEGRQAGEIFYVARIQVDKSHAKTLAELKPAPGMPAEVYIETGERTFFEYLAKPITDSFSRAFREQ